MFLDGYDMPNCHVFDEELNMNICLSPGIENWAIIAKPDTAFINDSLDIIEEMITEGQEYIEQKIA